MKGINQLQVGESVISYYLVKSFSFKTTNNNLRYLDLMLADKTGEISAKVWEISEEIERLFEMEDLTLIKVKGMVTEWQGKPQLKLDKLRPALPEDKVDIADYVPTAPYDPAFMFKKIMQYVTTMEDADLKKIVNFMLEEAKEKLLYYPAAQKNHHSIRGGLLYHIMTMLRTGDSLSQIYADINRDLLYAGIILHDLAKIEEMDANKLGIVSDYTTEGHLLGHIIQGIKKVDKVADELGINKETSMLLQHMILSHHNIPEYGSPKPPMIPEAELLHYIDMIDSRMYDMEKALSNTEESNFSERIWSLNNRRVYKRSYKSDEPSAT